MRCIAFTGQRYKIWKQITTEYACWQVYRALLLLVKDTKFESKSQHFGTWILLRAYCFYWSKIQNLKANHNKSKHSSSVCWIAFTGQRYKIWKQITTSHEAFEWIYNCFYWSKIQNLKANHNKGGEEWQAKNIAFTGQRYKIWKQITTHWQYTSANGKLLLLVKDTKFESKSQQITIIRIGFWNCFYWSKIQNLKANHNR